MKEIYEKPVVEVVVFDKSDMVVTMTASEVQVPSENSLENPEELR